MGPSAEDHETLRRIQEGDEAAFAGLVARLHRPLLRVAETFLGRGSAAEEVVQEAWLAVVDGLGRFEGRSTLKTWVGGIVANRARTRRAKDRREVPLQDDDGDDGVDPGRFAPSGFWSQPPTWSPGPDDALFRKQARAALSEEIERLPPGPRAVITLRDVEEWSSEEVCNVLGLTETNQRVLLHRGRSRLRAALEKRFAKGALR